MDGGQVTDLLEAIRNENINVYRASPQRLKEDFSQEAEIAQNYRGRLQFELLQNADDAMKDILSEALCIRYVVTPDALWVGNTGRPLNSDDVRGLCGVSASSKTLIELFRRATIGHKGMGFKSVLEITDAPEVYSSQYSFRFDPKQSLEVVKTSLPLAARAPTCRFPWSVSRDSALLLALGFGSCPTVFRFPFKSAFSVKHREQLARSLMHLPLTSLIFLKHLKKVEVCIQFPALTENLTWTVSRQFYQDDRWQPVNGFNGLGIYQIHVKGPKGIEETFAMAYDPDIPMDGYRGGLDSYAWEDIKLTEVAVAARLKNGIPMALEPEWRKLHVFLPSGEPCPYDLLISGAFNSDLSRQSIRIEDNDGNYNRYLLRKAAYLFCNMLLPVLRPDDSDKSLLNVLSLLDRGCKAHTPCPTQAAQALYEAMKAELGKKPLFLGGNENKLLTINELILPPRVADPAIGRHFRSILKPNAEWKGQSFPADAFCASDIAQVLIDHGAAELDAIDTPYFLEQWHDPAQTLLKEHTSEKDLKVDPLLSVLEGIWRGVDGSTQQLLAAASKRAAIFPTSGKGAGTIHRVATEQLACFYPPKALCGSIPLPGLCFLTPEIYGRHLNPRDPTSLLGKQMNAWHALFDIKEFKFQEVVRASLIKPLSNNAADSSARLALRSQDCLAAICQLSGRAPKQNYQTPLSFERTESNSSLFCLSRLDVPCRDKIWRPAYQVYFGCDWVRDHSVEKILMAYQGGHAESLPEIHFLAGPEEFHGLLDQFSYLHETVQGAAEKNDGDIDPNDDDDVPLDEEELSRWMQFFLWIGVNQALRPVHFNDVNESHGWIRTRGLVRPTGWAFQSLQDEIWDNYAKDLPERLRAKDKSRFDSTYPCFYRMHNLEHLPQLLESASKDSEAILARALYEHLTLNWSVLERFSQLEVAQLDHNARLGGRNQAIARNDEIVALGDNFWLHLLKTTPFCPTGFGPRRPDIVWWPTNEVKRRFGGKKENTYLLPVLTADKGILASNKARSFAHALGIREELSPSAFTLEDARVLIDRIHQYAGSQISQINPLHEGLQVIRAAYRNLLELLVGDSSARKEKKDNNHPLGDTLLLARNQHGDLAFMPASTIFYIERRETWSKLDSIIPVWSFILDAFPTAKAPLKDLFGVKTLEDVIHYEPQPGVCPLNGTEIESLRNQLAGLAPYILARIGLDRTEDPVKDAQLIRQLIQVIEPWEEIILKRELPGQNMPDKTTVDAYALIERSQVQHAYIAWLRDGTVLPTLSQQNAEAITQAFCEIFGNSYFDSFLALIQADSEEARLRLLKRIGADKYLAEKVDLFKNPSDSETEDVEEDFLPDGDKSAQPVKIEDQTDRQASESEKSGKNAQSVHRTSLYGIHQILVNGKPVIVAGKSAAGSNATSGKRYGKGHASNTGLGYGGRTDMDVLNDTGTAILLAYEFNRIQAVSPSATIFDPDDPSTHTTALVFDVSTPSKITQAYKVCQQFKTVMDWLAQFGISLAWPGFDVLTLDPRDVNNIGRMIELKSSGVDARAQEMSWNEWKSSTKSTIRNYYYLGLVGNLRTDLVGRHPFVRLIADPFGQMAAKIITNQSVERKIILSVQEFVEAEHLDLTIIDGSGGD